MFFFTCTKITKFGGFKLTFNLCMRHIWVFFFCLNVQLIFMVKNAHPQLFKIFGHITMGSSEYGGGIIQGIVVSQLNEDSGQPFDLKKRLGLTIFLA